MVTFSVIVPVYRAAHTIERCVDSLAVSGGEDIQIVLVEDCSPDNSWEVCQTLAEKYPQVTCCRNERNCGVSHTRNRGLELAEGQYLLFTDSDDWVDKDYVPTFRKAIREGHTFAICGYVNHDEKHAHRSDTFGWEDFEDTKTVSLKAEIEKLYHGRLLQQLWNKVFVTALVREHQVRFDESISIGEDTRFILDYIQRSGIREMHLMNRPLYHYMRDQDGSLMFRVGYESVEEPLKNLSKLYEIMEVSNVEERLEEDRRRTVNNYAYLIMHNAGMPRKEKKRLILALDPVQGKQLYRVNRKLYFKEQLVRRLR